MGEINYQAFFISGICFLGAGAVLMAAVPLVIAIDTAVFEHGVQETSVTEFAQKGLLILSVVLMAMTARRRPDSRGFLALVAGFFGVMLIREADWLFNCAITEAMLYFGGITITICR